MLYIVENHPLSPPIILNLSLTEKTYSKCFKYHEKNIKDIKFCNIPNSVIATVSLDKTLKLYSVENESMVLQYSTDKQLWSLDWNESNPNYLYIFQYFFFSFFYLINIVIVVLLKVMY